MKIINKVQLIFLVVIAVILSSCSDDDTVNDLGTTDLKLHFHPHVNGEDFAINETYSMNGNEVSFSRVQFYVSNIELTKEDGSLVKFDGNTSEKEDDLFLQVTAGNMMYDLGEVEIGTYKSINFEIGVDTVVNSTIEPTAWPTDHPLSADNPNHYYWSWNTGYIFAALEGTVNGEPFTYHIGTNDLITPTGNIDLNAATINGDNGEIMIGYNVAKFFNDIDLSIEENRSSHTMGTKPLALKVAGNIKSSFSTM
ncbi:hypothetical protein C9994_11595 [Marivirga lumbricoides]|uniref:Copper-binding protein MbnP-like domain-containing protein n=1 Tax=Marivirga lumbricoides TaxID=1046115 RepID=A0A2T4DMM8_9BACT|nr:hypothetical protein C9994_11595 [Marivirga lumbricoides]